MYIFVIISIEKEIKANFCFSLSGIGTHTVGTPIINSLNIMTVLTQHTCMYHFMIGSHKINIIIFSNK